MIKKVTELPLIQWGDNALQHPSSDIYFHNFVKQYFELYDTALEKVSIEIESKNLKNPCIGNGLKNCQCESRNYIKNSLEREL